MKSMLCLLIMIWPVLSWGALQPIERNDVKQFITEMVEQYQFDKAYLNNLFRQIDFKPEIIVAMTRPAEGLAWYKYRKIFLKPTRIAAGVKFWHQHKKTLDRAYQKFGVPPEMILAIIGVETFYGQYKGKHKVLESLTTLAFDYPKRSKFFRSELVHYLRLCREQGFDPLVIKGSYAGAVGYAQFISSSYRRLAIDFNGDDKVDLWNATDAIGSIANYFAKHGWQKDEPIVSKASVSGKKYQSLLKGSLKPKTKLLKMRENGVVIEKNWANKRLGKLMKFELEHGNEYWVGLNNFYVISRYNHSKLYSLAAYQLSQEIKAAFAK